jgi:hypothetical protein
MAPPFDKAGIKDVLENEDLIFGKNNHLSALHIALGNRHEEVI